MARKSARSIERLAAVLAPPAPARPAPARPGPTFPDGEERGVGPPGVGWKPPGPPVRTGSAPGGGRPGLATAGVRPPGEAGSPAPDPAARIGPEPMGGPAGPAFPGGEAHLLEPPGVRWRPRDPTASTGSAPAGSASAERWVFSHEPPLAVAPSEDREVVPPGASPVRGAWADELLGSDDPTATTPASPARWRHDSPRSEEPTPAAPVLEGLPATGRWRQH